MQAVDQLLKVRAETQQLKAKIIKMNDQMGEVGRYLVEKVRNEAALK